MSYPEILANFFGDMDSDDNGFIDSTEWLHHLKSKSTNAHRDKASRKLRSVREKPTARGDGNTPSSKL